MQNLRLALAALAVIAGGSVIAAEATNEAVKARQALMKEIAGATKVLGDMAQAKTPFDAEAAAHANGALTGYANQITDSFEPQETDPATKAKPEIWQSFDDFTTKADTLFRAALAADVSSLEAVQASMGSIGGACKSCHEAYRLAD